MAPVTVMVLPLLLQLKLVIATPAKLRETQVGEARVYSLGKTTVMVDPAGTCYYSDKYLRGIPGCVIIVVIDEPLVLYCILSGDAHRVRHRVYGQLLKVES